MAALDVTGDGVIRGTLVVQSGLVAPDGFLTNAKVQAGAGISASKLERGRLLEYRGVGTVTSDTIPLGEMFGAGSIKSVRIYLAGLACAGGATVTVDIKKNNTTILTVVMTLNDTKAVREVVDGTLSVTSYVADDIFDAVVVATAGGGTVGKGLYIGLVTDEDYGY